MPRVPANLELPAGCEILASPSGEHLAVVVVTLEDGTREVQKFLRPNANLEHWQARAAIANAHPDLFVPFRLEEQGARSKDQGNSLAPNSSPLVPFLVRQPFVTGPFEQRDADYIRAESLRRGIRGITDLGPCNVIAGRAVDFSLIEFLKRPHPRFSKLKA
jgi:hypothetical protein